VQLHAARLSAHAAELSAYPLPCLCVFCVGPLRGPPLRWWVLCGVLPSVWVPCGWGPPPSCSRSTLASTRVMSRARAPAPAYTPLPHQTNVVLVHRTRKIDAYYRTFAHLLLGTARPFTRGGSVSSRGRVWRIPTVAHP